MTKPTTRTTTKISVALEGDAPTQPTQGRISRRRFG